jgi:hypothetical protein
MYAGLSEEAEDSRHPRGKKQLFIAIQESEKCAHVAGFNRYFAGAM